MQLKIKGMAVFVRWWSLHSFFKTILISLIFVEEKQSTRYRYLDALISLRLTSSLTVENTSRDAIDLNS